MEGILPSFIYLCIGVGEEEDEGEGVFIWGGRESVGCDWPSSREWVGSFKSPVPSSSCLPLRAAAPGGAVGGRGGRAAAGAGGGAGGGRGGRGTGSHRKV